MKIIGRDFHPSFSLLVEAGQSAARPVPELCYVGFFGLTLFYNIPPTRFVPVVRRSPQRRRSRIVFRNR
jgi:hypothetical protein